MIRLERVLEILAPRLKADGERLGREIVVTLAEREELDPPPQVANPLQMP
jgi:hypothetical protein